MVWVAVALEPSSVSAALETTVTTHVLDACVRSVAQVVGPAGPPAGTASTRHSTAPTCWVVSKPPALVIAAGNGISRSVSDASGLVLTYAYMVPRRAAGTAPHGKSLSLAPHRRQLFSVAKMVRLAFRYSTPLAMPESATSWTIFARRSLPEVFCSKRPT